MYVPLTHLNNKQTNAVHSFHHFPSLHLQDDDWGLTAYPLIPGHEVVGTVKSVGSDVQVCLLTAAVIVCTAEQACDVISALVSVCCNVFNRIEEG